MNFREALTTEHSKKLALEIANTVTENPQFMEDFWGIIRDEAPPLPQRASWSLDKIVEQNPALMAPYLEEAIELLEHPNHNAVHRNIAKALSMITIPEHLQGILYDLCLNRIIDTKEKPAIQVHCMTTAFNIAKSIPELKEELAIIIEEGLDYGSAGFRSRGMRLLKQLRK